MIFAQLGRFASIGVLATLLHVLTAIVAQSYFGLTAQVSNLAGFVSAFGLSYLGHARVTFKVAAMHGAQLQRFLVISLLGLALSASITHLVHDVLNAPFAIAMLTVGVCVPLLTFLAAKYWVFSQSNPSHLRADAGSCFVVIFGAICYVTLQNNLINHDTAWYLVATRKWLEGARLYVDLIEVNPPLNFYLTAPAIWISDTFQLGDIRSQILTLVLLMTISLLWVWSLLTSTQKLDTRTKYLILVGAAFALTAPYLKFYGQREHILSIVLMPYLIASALGSNHEKTRIPEIARAVFAGVGLCLKPHFMLIPIAVALATAIRDKSLRPLASPSILTFLAMGLGYIALVKLWHPEYLDTIVPMALQVYGAYGHDARVVFENASPFTLGLIATVAVALIGSAMGKSMLPLLAATLACVAIYLAQWTGYGYQAKPFVALAALTSVFVAADKNARMYTRGLAAACLGVIAIEGAQTGLYQSKMTNQLAPYVTSTGPDPRLAVFSSSLWPSFPLALHTDAKWTSRYPALWLIPGAVNALASPTCQIDPASCQNYTDILAQTRSHIVTDFIAGQANVVIIDTQPFYINDSNFNYLDFLAEDPRFQAHFNGYVLLESSAKLDLYVADKHTVKKVP